MSRRRCPRFRDHVPHEWSAINRQFGGLFSTAGSAAPSFRSGNSRALAFGGNASGYPRPFEVYPRDEWSAACLLGQGRLRRSSTPMGDPPRHTQIEGRSGKGPIASDIVRVASS